ncbi:alpha/beta hydrolase [Hyphococcus flavus]|uniref:Alpha/beta hydrolase n=1 Tax=Hyphococcus flavus TaxID=1866326 RepID=A0AAE9ZBJ8_9PROT|nr:alpha/beta hydrolase [Hyphococcus flavus]WDI30200.1 alpha/beta hydrolase [Hyphococcus flavus]
MLQKTGIALLTGASLAISACVTAAPPPQLAAEEPYLFEPRNGDRVEAFKGTFEVPENRADPNSRMITLGYVRFPSTNPNPGAPIVYLAGGPGGTGVGTAQGRRFPLFMKLRGVADVIAFDQRGTGLSNHLQDCETDLAYPLDKPLFEDAITALYQHAARQCKEFWAANDNDISAYNTLESARDLDDLRAALGAEKINLWSISYGTHLAMAAVKIMDERVDRIVMTGAEGLHQTVKLPKRTDEFYGRIQSAIDQDPAAKAVYPDIAAMMRRVHAKLDADPAVVEIEGEGGAPITLVFGKADMQLLSAFSSADPRNVAQVLALYLAVDARQYEPAAALLYRYLRSGTLELSPMSTAMDIASGISDDRLALVREQAKAGLVGSFLNFPMPHIKDALPELDLGEEFRSLPYSNTPTLLLTGMLDGRTYPDSQAEAVAGFSDVTQIYVENAGHNLFMSDPEIGERIFQFLSGEQVSEGTIVLPLPDFTAPLQN